MDIPHPRADERPSPYSNPKGWNVESQMVSTRGILAVCYKVFLMSQLFHRFRHRISGNEQATDII